jgi:hypothetical protein
MERTKAQAGFEELSFLSSPPPNFSQHLCYILLAYTQNCSGLSQAVFYPLRTVASQLSLVSVFQIPEWRK